MFGAVVDAFHRIDLPVDCADLPGRWVIAVTACSPQTRVTRAVIALPGRWYAAKVDPRGDADQSFFSGSPADISAIFNAKSLMTSLTALVGRMEFSAVRTSSGVFC